jgi:hypothetical protein
MRDAKNDFWSYPPDSQLPLDEFRARSPISKLRWIMWPKANYPDIKLISEETNRMISTRIESTDQGVWDFFQYPEMVENLCRIAGEKISIAEFDLVVGIQSLGLALGVALAYHNRRNFNGKLVAWLGQAGFLPEVTQWSDKKILLVSLRIQFGTYLTDVVSEIQKRGGHVEKVLVAITDFETSSIFNRLRQNSLPSLAEAGIIIHTLSK